MAAGAVEVNVTSMRAFGGALFDGVDDYVEVAHNPNQLGANLTNGFTISAWINPRSIGEGGVSSVIIDKSTNTSAGDGFQIATDTTERVKSRINGGTSKWTSNNAAPLGVWTHVLYTVSSAQVQNAYINGVVNGSGADAIQTLATITTTNAPRIGNRSGATDRTFDGGISKVKMWNRVLTTDEIAQDYAGSPIPSGLILDIPLQNDYTDNAGNATTNSGSILTIQEDAVAAAIKADRTTANDKYLMVGVKGQIVSAVIEEAP